MSCGFGGASRPIFVASSPENARAGAFSPRAAYEALQTIKVPQIDFGRGGPSANWSLLIQNKSFGIWLHAELQN